MAHSVLLLGVLDRHPWARGLYAGSGEKLAGARRRGAGGRRRGGRAGGCYIYVVVLHGGEYGTHEGKFCEETESSTSSRDVCIVGWLCMH